MAHYVVLGNWTDEGITHIKGTVDRAEQAAKLAEQMGGGMIQILWTQGRYDFVAIFEAPNDEAASVMTLRSATGGHVRTETMRAYTADEMNAILAKLG
jgi:uncharacterized protein with GYD domain